MKQSRPYTALALVALTSALFLGACGGNKQEATTASSSAKTSQSSKMSSSSTKTKTEKKTQPASSEEMKVETPASQESQPAKQAEQSKENKKQDSATVAKEDEAKKVESNQATSDFAKFAGTWTNDEGETIVINPDGTTTAGQKLEDGQEQDNGIYTAGIRSPEGFGANFFYAPAGQAFPESMAPKEFVNTDGTDISRERIVIAQSVDRMAHPFYRTE